MATYKEINGKKGKKYQVTVRIKGYKPIYKTFDKKTAAKAWAEEAETQMRKGKYRPAAIKEVVTPILTVDDLITDFEKNIASKRYSKPEQYTHMYNWWRKQIGGMSLQDIDTPILTHCQNLLASESPDKPYKEHEKKSNSTVRKYMFALSAVLRYGVRSLKLLDRNPMADVDKPKKKKGVVRFLSDEEKELLIFGCKEYSHMLLLFVILALFSGGRYNEIRTLCVENIDFDNEMLHFLETKNGESRGVPVHTKVILMLKKYIEDNNIKSGYIFINPKTEKLAYLKGAFETVVKNIGLKNFRFHDCRHTYASWLAENGATLLEIATLLGHKNLNQVQIYAHLTKKTTSKLVRKMTANKFEFEF